MGLEGGGKRMRGVPSIVRVLTMILQDFRFFHGVVPVGGRCPYLCLKF